MALYSDNIDTNSKWMWSSITTGAISLLFFAGAYWGLSTNMSRVSTVFISQPASFSIANKPTAAKSIAAPIAKPKTTQLTTNKVGTPLQQKVNRASKRDSTFTVAAVNSAQNSKVALKTKPTSNNKTGGVSAVNAQKVALSDNPANSQAAQSNLARKSLSVTQLASLTPTSNDAKAQTQSEAQSLTQPQAQSLAQKSSTAPIVEQPFKPITRDVKVKSGDTLLKILKANGANNSEAHAIVNKLSPHIKVHALEIGQPLTITLDRRTDNKSIHPTKLIIPLGYRASRPTAELLGSIAIAYNAQNNLIVDLPSKDIAALSMHPNKPIKAPKFTPAPQKPINKTSAAKLSQKIASITAAKPAKPAKKATNVKTQTAYYRTRSWVKKSFSSTIAAQGVPKDVQSRLINVYNQTAKSKKIKSGDVLEVFFDQQETTPGKLHKVGKLLYISFKANGKVYTYYRFGNQFYDKSGKSINPNSGGFLAAPVPGVRMNSKFGMRRHPVTKRWKLHAGSDFAAPRGTPIYAAAAGKILIAKWYGGAGRFVRIDHQNGYKTGYFHMSRIAKGMKPGKKIRKGQIIGYVGSTGLSTGNHLHFEVIKNGKKVNPMKYIGRGGGPAKLTGTQLAKFTKEKSRITSKLNSTKAITKIAAR